MTLLSVHRESRRSVSTLFHELLLSYKREENVIYLYVEGNDDPSFYLNFVISKMPKKWRYDVRRCDGKGNVYKLHGKVPWKTFSRHRILFFVDKDLDDLIPIAHPRRSNIFVTKYYSCENYVTSELMVRRIVSEIFHIQATGAELNVIVRWLGEQQRRFYRMLLPIVAWTICARRRGIQPVVNNVKLAKLFSFDKHLAIQRKCGAAGHTRGGYVKQMCEVSASVGSLAEMLMMCRKLKRVKEPKRYVRGKWDLWFFVRSIGELAARIDAFVPGTKVPRPRTQLTLPNAMEILGPRVSLPPKLGDFLDHHMSKVKGE